MIEWLDRMNQEHPDGIVPYGFDQPISDKEDISFKPKENVKISDMLAHALSALAEKETYEMNSNKNCWIASKHFTFNEGIGPTLLKMWELSLDKST